MEDKPKNFVKNETFLEKAATKTDFTILMPVLTRIKKRVKEIKEMSRAKHTKVPRGNAHVWHTEPPQIFISGLQHSIQNGVGTINYTTYKMTKDGKKAIDEKYHEFVDLEGNKHKRLIDASYVLEEIIVEKIEKNKKIKVEKFKVDVM